MFKLEKKIVRIICNAGFTDHTESLFQYLDMLAVMKVYVHETAQFLYKYFSNFLPDIFNTMFHFNDNFHYYPTISAKFLKPPDRKLKSELVL